MNQSKIQKLFGYQRHSISHSRYITQCGSKKEICITISGLVSVQYRECNRYLTRGSSGSALSITTTGNVFVTRWVVPLIIRQYFGLFVIH